MHHADWQLAAGAMNALTPDYLLAERKVTQRLVRYVRAAARRTSMLGGTEATSFAASTG